MKTRVNFRKMMRDSIRVYFAPLTGAFKAVRAEMRRAERENARRTGHDRANHA